MKRVLNGAAALAAFCLSAASAEEADQDIAWSFRPTAELFSLFFPPEALLQNVEGRVVLECETIEAQRVRCEASESNPGNWGFGEAAVAMSRSFRLSPTVRDGAQVLGGSVRIPISFRMMDGDPTPDHLDLPIWTAAPNASDVRAAWAEGVAQPGLRARGVLSCLVNEDRSLACGILRATPEGLGAGPAALELSRAFRVAEADADFLARHRQDPFVLPINFGFEPQFEPVSISHTGLAPFDMPPLSPPSEVLPQEVRDAGISGAVIFLCTLQAAPPSDCAVESETPSGWGVGEALSALLEPNLFAGADSAMLPGDQVRVTVPFGSPDSPD